MKNYKNIPLLHEIEASASHQPALIWAVENTNGSVLELGCGGSSTLLLHRLLEGTNRRLLSVDDNDEWLSRFSYMGGVNHRFMIAHKDAWLAAIDVFAEQEWGVVFVDQGYTKEIADPARIYSVKKLVDHADYVIAHDADLLPQIQSQDYNWKIFYPKYTPIESRRGPPTYIVSTRHDLSEVAIVED